jgi:putative transposase
MTTMRKRHTPVFKAQIVRELLKEDQTQAQIASTHGVHPNQMREWREIALKGLPRLFEPGQDLAAQAASYEAKINELYAEIGRLTTQVAWLKKNLASNLRCSERLALIEREGSELSLSAQAELLSLSRSSLYYKPIPPTAEEIAVKHRIDEIYTESPFYESRKITEQLRREGILINRKAVQRHMREMGIAGITPGPNLRRRAQGHLHFAALY